MEENHTQILLAKREPGSNLIGWINTVGAWIRQLEELMVKLYKNIVIFLEKTFLEWKILLTILKNPITDLDSATSKNLRSNFKMTVISEK